MGCSPLKTPLYFLHTLCCNCFKTMLRIMDKNILGQINKWDRAILQCYSPHSPFFVL